VSECDRTPRQWGVLGPLGGVTPLKREKGYLITMRINEILQSKFKFRSRVSCFIISYNRNDKYLNTKILYRTLVKCRVIIVGKGDMGLEKYLNSIFDQN
jgi:hypothetical protein